MRRVGLGAAGPGTPGTARFPAGPSPRRGRSLLLSFFHRRQRAGHCQDLLREPGATTMDVSRLSPTSNSLLQSMHVHDPDLHTRVVHPSFVYGNAQRPGPRVGHTHDPVRPTYCRSKRPLAVRGWSPEPHASAQNETATYHTRHTYLIFYPDHLRSVFLHSFILYIHPRY